MKRKSIILSGAMALIMAVSLFAVPNSAKAAGTLKNPVIEKDSSMKAGQKVTYDTIYFGSYPQAEVVASVEEQYTVYETIRNGEDYIVDAKLHDKLKNATWKDNETTIGGEKYRRLKSEDATYACSEDDWVEYRYRWNNSSYHYFKYQPIKWRVLQVTDNEVFLMADLALDCKRYNEKKTDTSWEKCTLRKYLNNEFLQSAFSENERTVIINTKVKNENNLQYGTDGGKDTTDQIFLLSDSELYTEKACEYGFVSDFNTFDEARQRKSSTYAKAMGCESLGYDYWKDIFKYEDYYKAYDGNCSYWMRTPGYFTYFAAMVTKEGISGGIHGPVNKPFYGVCPALRINLASYCPTYAGTVCTDGTVNSVKQSIILQSQTIVHAKVKTYSAKKLETKKAVFSLNAETSGDGTLSYKVTKGSSKYIEVNKKGKVILKKGCPKGTYQVTITASKTSSCKKATKVVSIQVKK